MSAHLPIMHTLHYYYMNAHLKKSNILHIYIQYSITHFFKWDKIFPHTGSVHLHIHPHMIFWRLDVGFKVGKFRDELTLIHCFSFVYRDSISVPLLWTTFKSRWMQSQQSPFTKLNKPLLIALIVLDMTSYNPT